MTALPDNLPVIATARLPQAYEAAKTAIATCARIDECQEWGDRMEALASYARQSEDETLLRHAMRIKARAIDRCGELLREVPNARGNNQYTKEDEAGTHPIQSGDVVDTGFKHTEGIYAAGHAANMSTGQIKTALRVNRVDRDLFNKMVESDQPPTIEKLAAFGTKKRPQLPPIIDQLNGRDPADFEQATRLIGLFTLINERIAVLNVPAALRGLNDRELQSVIRNNHAAIQWLAELEEAIDVLQRR